MEASCHYPWFDQLDDNLRRNDIGFRNNLFRKPVDSSQFIITALSFPCSVPMQPTFELDPAESFDEDLLNALDDDLSVSDGSVCSLFGDLTTNYDTVFSDDRFREKPLQVNYIEGPLPESTDINSPSNSIQYDQGANASCTNDVSILYNVLWIEPIKCDTAKKGQDLSITAIGTAYLSTGSTTVPHSMYYSPDIPLTILSPNALIREHSNEFRGFLNMANFDSQIGVLRLIARDGFENVDFTLQLDHDLWYLDRSSILSPFCADDNSTETLPTSHCQSTTFRLH